MRFYFSFALLALPVLAMAESPSRAEKFAAKMEERFLKADVNKDGQLTQEEAKDGMPRIAKNFDKIDSDANGSVTLEQIEAFAMEQAASR